jgi:BASS family bile acid:Na+ symporter
MPHSNRSRIPGGFLTLLVLAYVAAALFPELGVRARAVKPFGDSTSLPALMLALLLFNAGTGVQIPTGIAILRSLVPLLLGVAASVIAPIAFVAAVSLALSNWHNHLETQAILIGLGLVAAMPVAGSSAGWSQNAGGDSRMSVGLILGSTAISPLVSPLALSFVGALTGDSFRSADSSTGSTDAFLLFWVVIPTAAGLIVRLVLTPQIRAWWHRRVRLINSATILALCYMNASAALPEIVREPDWDFLGMILIAVVAMCAFGFAAGAARFRANVRVSLSDRLRRTGDSTN